RTVARDEEVRSGVEQTLGVLPRRAHEGNPAGERLEHTDRGDAGERADVGLPWHVNGDPEAGVDVRRGVVGQPAAVLETGRPYPPHGVEGVAHTMDASAQSQPLGGLEQELEQFPAPLLVPPVTDPDDVALRGGAGDRREES